ncbi:CPBP family intramembrane glutamic endopeptidase, partial [Pseudomonadota bacterium]
MRSGTTRTTERKEPARLHLIVLVLLAAPFYLNDFASIYIADWRLWLLVDYLGVKLFPLAVTLWLIRSNTLQLADLGLVKQSVPSFIVVFVTVTLIGTLIDQNGYSLIAALPNYGAVGSMPPIDSPVWDWIDLTFGLLLVGVVEELVFRGYMQTFLRGYTERPVVIVAVSSVAFGLIHWSLGLHAVVITSIIGAVFMIAYLRVRALPAIMLAHFAINFIDFAGVVP